MALPKHTKRTEESARQHRKLGAIAFRVALAAAAFWALRRELTSVSMAGLVAQLRAYSASHVGIALICTVASFGVMGLVELMAVRQTPKRVPVPTVMATAFAANALSQSIGVALLTGTAVRARVYARRNLNAPEIAQITGFVTLTAAAGLMAASAVALFALPKQLTMFGIAFPSWVLGSILLVLIAAYVLWAKFGRSHSVGYGRWRLLRPSFSRAVSQLTLSSLDWVLAGTVLFAFMPTHAGLGFASILGAYLIAQTAGMTSHVPAGAGVFEFVILALVARGAGADERAAIVAALVMFRVTYYLLPLIVAIVASVAFELRAHAQQAAGTSTRAAPVGGELDHAG